MFTRVTVNAYLLVVFRFIVLAAGGFVLDGMLQFLEGSKRICGEINARAFDLGRLKDEFP